MRRSFLVNLAFVVLLNLLVKPAYIFGVEMQVQNRLGAEKYGFYFALLNCSFLLQIINDFGFQIFNNRQIAIDRSQIGGLFPGLTLLKIVFGMAYLVLLLILGTALGYSHALFLLFLIGFNVLLTSFILFFRSGLSGLGYYRIDSALSVLDKFFMLVMIGGMLLVLKRGGFTLFHFVVGQMAALVLTLFISWLLLRRYALLKLKWIPLSYLSGLAKKVLPYAIAVFLMTLYTRLDGVMIHRLLEDGDYEAGVYAAGYRILDACNMLSYLFAVLLLPMFSNALSSSTQLRALLDEGFRYMLMLVVPVCLLGSMLSAQIMILCYRQADPYWSRVFTLLIMNFLLIGMMYVFGTFLTATGRIRSMNVVFGTTVLLNFALNLLLIPRYKAAGAAIATLTTQSVALAGIAVLCVRALPVSVSLFYFLRKLGFVLACSGAGLALVYGTSLRLYLLIPAFLAFSLLAGFVFRVIRWSEVAAMFRAA